MNIQTLSAQEVRQKLAGGAVLIDVRGAAEYAREHIDGAVNVPLDKLAAESLPVADTLVFHCQSGMRTAQNAAALQQASQGKTAYILEHGIQGWKAGGFDTVINRSRPLDLMRQVQIGAGLLALSGALGGWLVSPWLYLLCGMVGAGLLLAGLTGFCGMARLLMLMPWNQSLRQQAKSS
ncbi:rhodanese family protein [Neisseria yangbaofengii]|uniref:rhodanese family protein n=1 Tax=Neisseria yangbaofengii TaxID=2709396 RepID=UPI0013ECD580|nr:rhodanese family protein [Neisseria yangbaofengii]